MSAKGGKGAGAALAAFAVALAVFVPVAIARSVVRDEGFYLLAAELVTHGRLPYVDFFYPQMPFLPYLYGSWLQLAGSSWIAARVLSALVAAATAAVLFADVRRTSASSRQAALGVALYLCCDVVLCWYSTAKFYAVAAFLLLAAAIAARSSWRAAWAAPLVAGFCAGLAANVRLLLAVALPVLALAIRSRVRAGEAPRGSMRWFVVGAAVALAPSVALLVAAPEAFGFDNVGYHWLRSDAALGESLLGKLKVLLALCGLVSIGKGYGFALPLLLGAAASWAGMQKIAGQRVDPELQLAAALLLAHFVPSPIYVQYFAILVPLLIPAAVFVIRQPIATRTGSPLPKPTLRILWGAMAVLYVALLPVSLRAVLGSRDRDEVGERSRSRSHVEAVRDAIDRATEPGDAVYASWPGYLFGSHAIPLAGTENNFGVDIAAKLPPELRARYHLRAHDDMQASIGRSAVRAIVVPRRATAAWNDLEAQGFAVVGEVGEVLVHARRSGG